MKKNKEKVELRYYEVAPNEYLLALQGDSWKKIYAPSNGLLHFHNLLEVGICREGRGRMLLERESVDYTEGTITVIPENYPHTTVSAEGTKSHWEYLFVDSEKLLAAMYPDDLLFQKSMLERINRRPFVGRTDQVPELVDLVHAILAEMDQKQDGLYRESVRGLALALLIGITRIQEESDKLPQGISAKSGFEQMKPALDYIRENYASNLKISEIAAVCHMSESHFRRMFDENIGMTPVAYLNQVRIRKACDLIKRTGYSMEEVSLKVGFTTASTFNRNFKKITGTSPYQWKKQPENFESRLANFSIMIEKGW